METLIEKAIKRLTDEMNEKRDALIIERLESVAGVVGINLIEERSKRFPRIKCELHENGAQVWYWNDGSIYGQRLITIEPDYDMNNNDLSDFKLRAGFKIY